MSDPIIVPIGGLKAADGQSFIAIASTMQFSNPLHAVAFVAHLGGLSSEGVETITNLLNEDGKITMTSLEAPSTPYTQAFLGVDDQAAARVHLGLTSAAVGNAAGLTSGLLDPARIPVLPSQVQIMSEGGLADLTEGQQDNIDRGTVVTTTDGKRWVYSGTGSKVDDGSYVLLADVTPEWAAVANRPAVVLLMEGLANPQTFGVGLLEATDSYNLLTSLGANPVNLPDVAMGSVVTINHNNVVRIDVQNGALVTGSIKALEWDVNTGNPRLSFFGGAKTTRPNAQTPGAALVALNLASAMAPIPASELSIATQTEAEVGTNSTKTVTPQRVRQAIAYFMRSNVRQIELSPAGWAFNYSGSGQRGTDRNIIDIVTGTTTGSFVHVRNNAGGTNTDMVFPGDQYNVMVWSRPLVCAFTFAVQNADGSTMVRIKFGDFYSADTVADFTNRGVGIIVDNTGVKVTVHNGTTLYISPSSVFTITSGGAPTLYAAALVLDGTGAWALEINGSIVATGSGAPTTNSATNGVSISAGATNGAGFSSCRLMMPEISIIRP